MSDGFKTAIVLISIGLVLFFSVKYISDKMGERELKKDIEIIQMYEEEISSILKDENLIEKERDIKADLIKFKIIYLLKKHSDYHKNKPTQSSNVSSAIIAGSIAGTMARR